MIQVPTDTIIAEFPDTAQTEGEPEDSVTGKPEDAVAESSVGLAPHTEFAGAGNVIVCGSP
jgi:hypothetical protein